MEIILFPILTIIVFLSLTERITIYLSNTYGSVIRIDFNLLGIELKRGANKAKKSEKTRKKKRKSSFSGCPFLYLLKGSSFDLYHLVIYTKNTTPDKDVLSYQGLKILFYIVYPILINNTKTFGVGSVGIYYHENLDLKIEYDLSIRLHSIRIITAFLIYYHKRLIGRLKKYVGK